MVIQLVQEAFFLQACASVGSVWRAHDSGGLWASCGLIIGSLLMFTIHRIPPHDARDLGDSQAARELSTSLTGSRGHM
jgi:hypothetical protein